MNHHCNQHSHASPHYQWAAGSAAGGSASMSNAGAFPAMAVNTGSAPPAPEGTGGVGTQPYSQQNTQPRMEQPISKNKSPLPKLNIKGGDPTTLTRVINEWIQKTAIALNTWSIEASNFWNQSVNTARQQHNWWAFSCSTGKSNSHWIACIFPSTTNSSASA